MLNLSDKELDRFSKEAAEEHEPGDVLGPRSWDRLELRINQEFGHPGWGPIRHIRRFPFYYAPALLVLLGVVYYLMRPGASSGSSPGATAKAPTQKTSVQTQNPDSDNKATSTPATSSTENATSAGAAIGDGKDVSGGVVAGGASAGVKTGGAAGSGVGRNVGAANPGKAAGSGVNGVNEKTGGIAGSGANGVVTNHGARGSGRTRTGGANRGRGRGAGGERGDGGGRSAGGGGSGDDNTVAVTVPLNGGTAATKPEHELHLSTIQRPNFLGRRNAIGDSALRAFTAKSIAPALIKKKGIYRISRNWQFGLMIAPDFASVNSLAGDKAGSSLGLTVDYQFAPHWYISSGILATRKNYAARSQDYHVPQDFYQQSGIWGNVNYVKGSFYMMEIPLNLRYDFSVSGNTLFFISAGASSYLMTSENANLYFSRGARDYCDPVTHLPIKSSYICSTINLSAGVETGLTNSLSLLIAPYMKLPAKNLGFGQVQMNSVGINFALKFSPVTSRKRN
jgi:hypothetical protein